MADRRIKILKMIQTDVEKDIEESEGELFTGHNVHVLFGKQAAAIKTLAEILETVIDEASQ